MDRTKKQPTIQDVARRAGVSTATVSRTITSPDAVSEAKRELVQEAIRSTDYRVNRAARSLRTQRSNTILALLPALGNPFFSQVLQGIENVLTPEGQALIVAETQQMTTAGDTLNHYLEDQRADGVIVLDGGLSSASVEALAGSAQASRVVFACEWVNDTAFPSVRSSNIEGASLVVKHLHELGHRHIAHVMGPTRNVLSAERLEGFLTTCKALNITHSTIEGDFTLEAGAQSADELLKLDPKPTAVFCASDTTAFGLISALTKRGLSVPNDISVVGFDDLELCEHFIPSLSSIHQDRIELGSLAARLLLQCMNNGPQPNHIERLPVQLIKRDSCASITA